MRSMSQLGNDLYTGKTSFPFVGRRRLWFIIAAILVIGSALVPLFRPIQFSIEFTGGSQFTVSGVSSPDQSVATEAVQSVVPDAVTKVTTVGASTVRVQTDQLTPAESQQVTTALADAYEVPVSSRCTSARGRCRSHRSSACWTC
jgi:preprotein translocase subunit SecF